MRILIETFLCDFTVQHQQHLKSTEWIQLKTFFQNKKNLPSPLYLVQSRVIPQIGQVSKGSAQRWKQPQLPSSIHKPGSTISADTILACPFPYDTQAYITTFAVSVCFHPMVPETSQVYPSKLFLLTHDMEKEIKTHSVGPYIDSKYYHKINKATMIQPTIADTFHKIQIKEWHGCGWHI